jgi:hypothetical protein
MQLAGGFTTQLSLLDRRRLRLIIRNVHLNHYPTEHLTDYECDKLIDAWGPEAAAQQIRDAMTLKLVE